ncbi:MAG: gas vesicle protein GvpJ [Pseudomonadota bacterium]
MSFEVQSPIHRDSLADVLERILDKGVVIAGDVTVSLVGIELLSIRLRILVATVDKAKELGINWWESDPMLSSQAAELTAENETLRERIADMEARLAKLGA